LYPDPNNGAAFVPESKTSLAGATEWPGFLHVGLKMAEKKDGSGKNLPSLPPAFKMYIMYFRFTPKLKYVPG
jgi:hypothetical protein